MEQARAWSRGESSMTQARAAAYAAHAAAAAATGPGAGGTCSRPCCGPPALIRDFVLNDEQRHNDRLWSLFNC